MSTQFKKNISLQRWGITTILALTAAVGITIIIIQILDYTNSSTTTPATSTSTPTSLSSGTEYTLGGYRGTDPLGYDTDVKLTLTTSGNAYEELVAHAGHYFQFLHLFEEGETYEISISPDDNPCQTINQTGVFKDKDIHNVIIECPPSLPPACPRYFADVRVNSVSPDGDGNQFYIDLYFGNVAPTLLYSVYETSVELDVVAMTNEQIHDMILSEGRMVTHTNPNPTQDDYQESKVQQVVADNRYVHFAWHDGNEQKILPNISNLNTTIPVTLVAPVLSDITADITCGEFIANGTLSATNPDTYTVELYNDRSATTPVGVVAPESDGTWTISFASVDNSTERTYYCRSSIGGQDSVPSNSIAVLV